MHELGVVFHVIKELEEVARENELDRISRVTLSVGEVSTVIPYYLRDCWEWAVSREQTPQFLKNAGLELETIPAVTHCSGCGGDYPTVEHGKSCPYCGSSDTYLLQGNEFVIKEIEGTDGS